MDGMATLQVPGTTVYSPPALLGCTPTPGPTSNTLQPVLGENSTPAVQVLPELIVALPVQLPPVTLPQVQSLQPRASV